MAIIKYERGSDGVVRESVSNDGGKSFSSTGANSSNGYSGSSYKAPTTNSGSSPSSSKKPASTSSNKNTGNSSNKNTGNSGYSGYTQDQYNNQSAYLDNMINTGTAGQKEWAKSELNNLNSQYGGNKNSGGNGYFMPTNPDGSGVQYNNTDVGTWDTSGQKWTNVGGTDDVNYAISGDNGTIIVTDSNGVQTRFLPTSADYNSFFNNMMNDIKAAGNSYTPHYTNDDGEATKKAYTWGNEDLQYAMQQAAKENPGLSVEDYVMSFYDRIGQANAAGDGTVTVPSVDAELDRLGLSDWNSQNAILTAGQTLLPGNEFVTIGPDKTGDEGTWGFYGGQQYRLDGDLADFVEYVNGKTGNLNNNLSYIFGDMANNPYAQQDPEFMEQYQQGQNQFNNISGITGNSGTNGSYTGNANVDGVISYINSVNNYNSATGGTINVLDMVQDFLNSGLEANRDFLAQQRSMAEQQAQQQASDAYVNKILAGDAMAEQMSAMGLGTSGAVQSAQMGIQGDYSNNLAAIRNNLSTMLNSLSEQEMQILADYYNNMANYAYQVSNDEADRALQNAQLALQLQQTQYDQEMARQQMAFQQAQFDWQKQQADREFANSQSQYNDSQKQYAEETAYAQRLQQAAQYANLYNAGAISAADYQNALKQLGFTV